MSNSSSLSNGELKQFESKLRKIEDEIADMDAEANFNTSNDNVKHLVDDTDNLNCIKMWHLKKNLNHLQQILMRRVNL